jgi:hypothetical protein
MGSKYRQRSGIGTARRNKVTRRARRLKSEDTPGFQELPVLDGLALVGSSFFGKGAPPSGGDSLPALVGSSNMAFVSSIPVGSEINECIVPAIGRVVDPPIGGIAERSSSLGRVEAAASGVFPPAMRPVTSWVMNQVEDLRTCMGKAASSEHALPEPLKRTGPFGQHVEYHL